MAFEWQDPVRNACPRHSGRVHTVEPIKDLLPLFCRDLLARVDDAKLSQAMRLGQGQAHLTAGCTVAGRIIQQDGGQLLQLGAVSVHIDAVCNIGMQFQSLFEGNAFKGERLPGHQTAQVNPAYHKRLK